MPTLRLSEPAIRHNIETVLDMMVNDPNRWRPHLKTTKCSAAWKLLPEYGLTNVKCATLREARVFLDSMADLNVERVDLLVAYALRNGALHTLNTIAESLPKRWNVSVLVEDPAVAASCPTSLDMVVDLNPGMNRTGIPFDDHDRLDTLLRTVGHRLRGIHAYEGHLAGLDPETRSSRADTIYESLDHILRSIDLPRGLEVVTSGTPAFPEALRSDIITSWMHHGWIHRVSPGTVILHDARTAEDVPCLRTLRAAAVVDAEVISRPAPNLVTVNAGSKSIAAEAGNPCAEVIDHPEWRAETPSEEHLPIRVDPDSAPPYGTTLTLMPRHVCPTVNLAETAVFERCDGSTEIVAIDARAHDLIRNA